MKDKILKLINLILMPFVSKGTRKIILSILSVIAGCIALIATEFVDVDELGLGEITEIFNVTEVVKTDSDE